MSINTQIVADQAKRIITTVGRGVGHSMYANEIEFYACAFELVDGVGNTVSYFLFPVMPSSIVENTATITNVKKASASVVSLFNPTFNPFSISLSGNFGRKFRLMLGNTEVLAFGINISESIRTGETASATGTLSNQVKSGYGASKALEKIIKDSLKVDERGRPYKLFFYNLSFNSSHLVEVRNFSFNQDERANMIWNYNISMQAIAPAYAVRPNDFKDIKRLMTLDRLSAFTNSFTLGQKSSYLARKALISSVNRTSSSIISGIRT